MSLKLAIPGQIKLGKIMINATDYYLLGNPLFQMYKDGLLVGRSINKTS